MTSKKILVYLVAFFALAVFLIANVSASFGSISDLEVKGVDTVPVQQNPISVSAGETFPVRVTFDASDNAEDVRVKAWISGERELASISERFLVFSNNTYSWIVSVQVPRDLDEIGETLELNVVIENRNDGIADEKAIDLTLQRESYIVEVLDVDMVNEASAGEVLTIDVVLKNLGAQFADETFVRARIDALGIEDRVFFGDLSSTDEPFGRSPFEDDDRIDRLNKEDSAERRLFLRIPSDAKPGVYEVEVEAFNEDSSTSVTRKIAIKGAEDSTMVVAPVHSRSFNVGEKRDYSLTVVNTGDRIRVFELVVESPEGLNIDVSDPVVAVPAGSSMTVRLQAEANEAGKYNFAVNVHSGEELVKRESFTANVVAGSAAIVGAASQTVLLTVVLAIIFIVLLIVLIVLLTRRTEKTEEGGEGYY